MLHYHGYAYSSLVNFFRVSFLTPKLSNYNSLYLSFYDTSMAYCNMLPSLILHCLILFLNTVGSHSIVKSYCLGYCLFPCFSGFGMSLVIYSQWIYVKLSTTVWQNMQNSEVNLTTFFFFSTKWLYHKARRDITMSPAILQKCFNFPPNLLWLSL